jgi:hypothetical protein
MKKYSTFGTQLGESVQLTDKAKLSLYKKSQNSGISTDILEEVYRRGYRCWTEAFGGTPEQFAFDRVNSFIADGFAAQLDEDLKKACWKGYEAIGMKKKNGKTVPNCVPVKEQLNAPLPPIEKIAKKFDKPVDTIKDVIKTGSKVEKEHTKDQKTAEKIAKAHVNERPDYYKKLDKAGLEEQEEARSKDSKKPSSRFIGSDELVTIYKSQTPGQIIKKVVRETLEEGDVIKTKFATKNLQKRGIEGPHKIDTDDFQRAWAYNKMPKSAEKHDYIAYHGTNARIMSDPSKGKHVDIKHGGQPSLIIDPDGSKTGKLGQGRGIYAFGDPVKTSVIKKQAPKKSGNVVKIKETIEEATYKGKTVPLNKPMKGDVKKSKVFVDPDGDGKAKKVNFGDKSLSIKKHIPARKKSYCARSGGQGNLTDKSSANYWSRRAWNCEETEVNELSVPAGTTGKRKEVSTPMVAIRMASGKIEKHPPGKSGSSGGGGDEE